jgi:protein gp37
MSTNTKISWATKSWSPILGCERVSSGCDSCYAIRTVHRLAHNPSPKVGPLYVDLTESRDDRLDWTGDVRVLHGRLMDPLGWRKPERIFVNSQADLFHKDVPRYFIVRILAVMALAPQHTFLVLTKRHARMKSLMSEESLQAEVRAEQCKMAADAGEPEPLPLLWPLRNLHLGVSVEDQHWADIRIPALLATPAAVRWISAEPLLGALDVRKYLHCPDCEYTDSGWFAYPCEAHGCEKCGHSAHAGGDGEGCGHPDPNTGWCECHHATEIVPAGGLDGLVVGGESGPNARPMHPGWVRWLREQCDWFGVPFHLKQWGEWAPAPWKGEDGATHAFTGGRYMKDDVEVEHFMKIGHSPISSERNDETPDGAQGMRRVGKKAAGRELDGQTYDEYPGVAA